jgi:hypothetical protein
MDTQFLVPGPFSGSRCLAEGNGELESQVGQETPFGVGLAEEQA